MRIRWDAFRSGLVLGCAIGIGGTLLLFFAVGCGTSTRITPATSEQTASDRRGRSFTTETLIVAPPGTTLVIPPCETTPSESAAPSQLSPSSPRSRGATVTGKAATPPGKPR